MGSKALARAAVWPCCARPSQATLFRRKIFTDRSSAMSRTHPVPQSRRDSHRDANRNQLTREVVTNEAGAYTIPNIPSGTYQVS